MSEFLTVATAAERLGVSESRIYQLAREGHLPHIRRGRRVVIPTGAWTAWVREQERQALQSVRAGDRGASLDTSAELSAGKIET